MHSLRLLSNCSMLYRQLSILLEKNVKQNFSSFYSSKEATETNINEAEQFKAAVLHPKKSNLNVETLVLPNTIADGMVRVGIAYCALNSFDVKCIHQEIDSITLPFIPGSEFSGEILEIGQKCRKNFKVGDKIAVLSGSRLVGGGLSQQCFVPETECIQIDPRLSLEQAATVIQSYSNAFLAFTKYAPLNEGDEIIICAGPGGDGLAAAEIAHKIFKANACVLFASTSVQALLRDDAVYKAFNLNAGLTKVYNFLKITNNSKKFKAVYDAHDSKLLHVVADFISANGQFLTEDPFFDPETFKPPYFKKDTGRKKTKGVKKPKATIEDIEAPEEIHWAKHVKKVDITKYQTADPEFYEKTVKQVFDWFATNKINPYVSHTYTLRDINKAIQFINSKKCLGKILIETQRKRN